ncbi:MAG TPA: methyltransferase domain-containing protein [Phnomibacter sp.]|nr:methyltransferase domain-containing protein [Phnomibacter sp.]
MSWLQQRAAGPELLDAPHINTQALYRNLDELNLINQRLGGHATVLAGLKALCGQHTTLSVAELGSGGGDNLAAMVRWGGKKGVNIQPLAIDLKADCNAYARKRPALAKAEFYTCDYRQVLFTKQPDIIFSSLFCHHFTNQQLVDQLQWMQANSRLGFFIADVHRHPLAYGSIWLLTRLFSKSYLVKHDAPLSVARGFKSAEWHLLLQQAGIKDYALSWHWAFRYLIVYKHHAC